jgi:hypothetical protein
MTVTAPNTLSVAQAIQTMAQAFAFLPINGITGYNTVSIGAKKDVTNLLPLLEITGKEDRSERDSMGGIGNLIEINDSQTFEITTTVDYTDSTTGEQVMFALRDALTQAIHSSAHLGGTTGIIGVYLESPGRYGYAMRNGVWCRMYQTSIIGSYRYDTTVVA